MHYLRIVLIVLTSLSFALVQAQDIWSLEKCMDYALKNAPLVSQANLDLELANLDYRAQKNLRLPTLNGTSNAVVQFGRTIDPTTNSFDNQRITSNSLGLNGEWMLFAGGQTLHNIKRQGYLLESTKWSQVDASNQLKLNVLAGYLETLLATDQYEQVKFNLKDLQQQLRDVKRQVAAGTNSPTQRLEVEAQIAQLQQILVQAKYRIASAYATLRNTLFLPPEQEFQLEREAFEEILPVSYVEQEVYRNVQQKYPSILAQEANLRAVEYEIKAARSQLFPIVGIFAGVNTGYSSVGTRIIGMQETTSVQTAVINGESSTIEFFNAQNIREKNPYFSQLNENFGQQVGVFFRLPLFDQGSNRINIQRSQINLIQSKLNYDNTKQSLNFAVQQALIDVKAAWEVYESAQQNVEVNAKLLKNKAREYEIGVTNALDYFTTRNQHQNAILQLIQSKYDYIYKTKIVALYESGSF
ncbi:MAG: TolC family protein [Bacteroidota bacterium]